MSYEMVVDRKYDLQELNESITMKENIDEVAARIEATFLKSDNFPDLKGGEDFTVFGKPYDGSKTKKMFSGVVWESDDDKSGSNQITLTCYDRSIYMAKSEEEYLFSKGKTASQRIKEYASDWGIPLGEIQNTNVPLSKSVYRAQTIKRMIENDLNETSDKGGGLFLPRMNNNKLELVHVGSNKEAWILETTEEISRTRGLEDSVTKVKVLGKEEEDKRSPVLAEVSEKTKELGTIQRVIQDSDITNKSDAEKAAKKRLSGVSEQITVSTLDINTIRVGDAVKLDGDELFVTSVKHDFSPAGMMSLKLGSLDYIRRKFYEG